MDDHASTLRWMCVFLSMSGILCQGYGTGSSGGSNPFKTRADFEAEMGGPGMSPVLPPGEDQYFPPPDIPKPDEKLDGSSKSTEEEEEEKPKKRPDCPVVGFSGESQLNTPDVKFKIRNLGSDAKIPGFGNLAYPGRVLEKSPKWEPGDEVISFKEDQFVEGGFHTSYAYNPDCEPVEGSNVVSAHAKNTDIEPEPYEPAVEAVTEASTSPAETAAPYAETPAPFKPAETPAPYVPPAETPAPYVPEPETELPYVPEQKTAAPYIHPETESPYGPPEETPASYIPPEETPPPYVPPQTEAPYIPPARTPAPYVPAETSAPYVPPETLAPPPETPIPPATTAAPYVPLQTQAPYVPPETPSPSQRTPSPYAPVSSGGSYGIENEVDIPDETTLAPAPTSTSAPANNGKTDTGDNYGQSVKPSDLIDENEDGVEYVDELTPPPPPPPPAPRSQPIPVPRALPSPSSSSSSYVAPPSPIQVPAAYRPSLPSYVQPHPPVSFPQPIGGQPFGSFQQPFSPVSYPQPPLQPAGCCGGSWFSSQGSFTGATVLSARMPINTIMLPWMRPYTTASLFIALFQPMPTSLPPSMHPSTHK
ncbi:unnamed protein product [Bursaphelenchus xylophilus]|uniref:(pine wood nematode) hypothetical protein n=1 Tax=Bursaphelenchus xylophilus TaxID=6326 RepID=A0A1I7S3I6_BURXY|nr:unnamed protein product [Bursaphelenchus xylophilus]CAG9116334.1 unnamed protein product [Bursaphelenchus xylophilus]